MEIVKLFARLLRWPVERMLPICRKVRPDLRAGTGMPRPILEQRMAEITAADREVRPP